MPQNSLPPLDPTLKQVLADMHVLRGSGVLHAMREAQAYLESPIVRTALADLHAALQMQLAPLNDLRWPMATFGVGQAAHAQGTVPIPRSGIGHAGQTATPWTKACSDCGHLVPPRRRYCDACKTRRRRTTWRDSQKLGRMFPGRSSRRQAGGQRNRGA
jgi:hypothetical protein